MKLLLTQDDNWNTFPRHSGGKFNLECNGGSGLLPLPGVGIVVGKEGIPLLFWNTIQYGLEKPGIALSYQYCIQEKLVWELPRKSKDIQMMYSTRILLFQLLTKIHLSMTLTSCRMSASWVLVSYSLLVCSSSRYSWPRTIAGVWYQTQLLKTSERKVWVLTKTR